MSDVGGSEGSQTFSRESLFERLDLLYRSCGQQLIHFFEGNERIARLVEDDEVSYYLESQRIALRTPIYDATHILPERLSRYESGLVLTAEFFKGQEGEEMTAIPRIIASRRTIGVVEGSEYGCIIVPGDESLEGVPVLAPALDIDAAHERKTHAPDYSLFPDIQTYQAYMDSFRLSPHVLADAECAGLVAASTLFHHMIENTLYENGLEDGW